MTTLLKNYSKHLTALVVFLIAYAPAFRWMWDRWWERDSYYSHGILIPFVTAFLIWQIKDEIAKIKPKESSWGLPLIVAGVLVHLAASLFRVYFVSAFSMLVVLIGLVLYFFGAEFFKKIAFPVLFLLFMIPLPWVVIANLSFKLKLFAAELSLHVIRGIGIQAIRDGSVIMMPHAHVIVEDVCSGLRSLISLMALGTIFAYWFKGAMWKRILIFLFTIPIAIITNMCRVVILSVISEVWGTQYADGFVHDATGMLVFVIAFVLLYAVTKLME